MFYTSVFVQAALDECFINKPTDSPGEEFETETWLEYPKDLKYITQTKHKEIVDGYDEVLKMLIAMINNPDKWGSK